VGSGHLKIGTTVEAKPRELLVGDHSFQQFINHNAAFVDKTKMILDLIRFPGPFFIARPRRFGKTLLIDTINNIFEGNKQYFVDLDIGKEELGHTWETFPVIRFSFNACDTDPKRLSERLIYEMETIAENYNLDVGGIRGSADISKVISKLSERQSINSRIAGFGQNKKGVDPRNVVILVDDYDFPLLGNIGDDVKILEIRKTLQAFYNSIKASYGKLRFVLVTGITKQYPLFSALNSIDDISLSKTYSTICGFTPDEIKKYFGDHLSVALQSMKEDSYFDCGDTEETILNELMDWHGGYNWDGKTQTLNPYSVASFFQRRDLGCFWCDTGSPQFVSLAEFHGEAYFRVFSKSFAMNGILPFFGVDPDKDEAALFQSGYLTIDSVDRSSLPKRFNLKVPNMAVSFSIVQELVNGKGILLNPDETLSEKYVDFTDAFDSRDQDQCAFLFSSCMADIAMRLNPQTDLFPQILLFTLLNIKGPHGKMEVNNINGTVDLYYFSPKNYVTVIDINFEKEVAQYPKDGAADVKSMCLTASAANTHQNTPEGVSEILDSGIAKSLERISQKKYRLPDYVRKMKIFSLAIAAYGFPNVKFCFKEEPWAGTFHQRHIQTPASDA
jgi:hypothetical protein